MKRLLSKIKRWFKELIGGDPEKVPQPAPPQNPAKRGNKTLGGDSINENL
jgi:hypothetical protein